MRYSMATADEALDATFQAGALSLCPRHEYNIIRSKDPALKQKAHAIATAKIEGGHYSSEHSLLMEAIDDVFRLAQDDCPCCANICAYQARFPGKKPCPCRSPTCPKFASTHTPDWSI